MWNNDTEEFPDIEAMFEEADALGFHVGLHNNAGTPEANGGDALYVPENEATWVKSYMDSVITTGFGDWFWPDEFDVLGSNSAPVLAAKGAYEAWKEYTDESRPMFLTRGSYAGQHFASAWSGDISPSSEELLNQVGFSLDAGLVGYWAVSHDLGGFTGRPTDELYTRWVAEFGAWNGIMRTHGHGGREPWTYNETAQETLKKNLKIRYALYPYTYSLAWQGYSQGVPMMRAMILEDESQYNPDAWDLNQQYYYGDWFLVAPAAETTDAQRSVWLPPDTVWYNYYTGERYEGGEDGKTIVVAAALDEIPVFVKGGAIVPMGPDVQYADELPLNPLTLDIYPHGESTFTLYEDDGVSREYITENAYTTTQFDCVESESDIQFTVQERQNGNASAYVPEDRFYNLQFHHIQAVSGVTVNDAQVAQVETMDEFNVSDQAFLVDENTGMVYVKTKDTGEKIEILLHNVDKKDAQLGEDLSDDGENIKESSESESESVQTVDAFEKIEAESGVLSEKMVSAEAQGASGGAAVSTSQNGASVAFAGVTGENRKGLEICVKSKTGGRIIVYENGVGDKVLAMLDVPVCDDWTVLRAESKNTDAVTGMISVEFLSNTGDEMDMQMDYFRFVSDDVEKTVGKNRKLWWLFPIAAGILAIGIVILAVKKKKGR